MKIKFLLSMFLCLTATPAFAGSPCTSAKDFVNMAETFYGDHPEQTNIITPTLDFVLKGLNGHPVPSHILYRHDGFERRLDVIDGRVMDIDAAANWSKDGELCKLIKGEMGPETEDNSAEANVSFSFPYKRTDGIFSLDEILEGAKDGSKIMKGLAPGGLGFVVPKLKAISVDPAEGVDGIPVITFYRKGEPVNVKTFGVRHPQLVRLKDLKSAKAESLKIEGPYVMTATFKFDPEEIEAFEVERLAAEAGPAN